MALPANPTEPESARVYRIRALWLLDRRALAIAAEDQVLLNRAGDADEVLELARWHLLGRDDAPSAWRLLAPIVAKGCLTASACQLAARAISGTAAQPQWLTAARMAAPVATLRASRAQWLAAILLKIPGLDEASVRSLLEAEAREAGLNSDSWLAYLPSVAVRLGGGQGRAVWLQSVLAANPSQQLLIELGTSAAIGNDRALAVQLLKVATEKGVDFATDFATADSSKAFQWLAWAYARVDDKRALRALAIEHVDKFVSSEARLALARSLLRVDALAEAEKWLAAAGAADNAIAVALDAEIARQRRQPTAAFKDRLLSGRVTGDVSLGALILAQFWWRTDVVGSDALLGLAARTAGSGQLTASRLRAFSQTAARAGSRGSLEAVQTLVGLLTTTSLPAAQVFADEPEPAVADLRRTLSRYPFVAGQTATLIDGLQAWAKAGVADATVLRRLATLQASRGDVSAALATDTAARNLASADLAEPQGRAELIANLEHHPPALARWFAEASYRDWDSRRELKAIADKLMLGQMGALGRIVLERALIAFPTDELLTPEIDHFVSNGSADLVIDRLAARVFRSPALALADGPALVRARLELGQVAAAGRDLQALLDAIPQNPRSFKVLFDVASSNNLCSSVAAMVPRMLAEPDLYLYKHVVSRGLDCARRLQDEAQALEIVKGAFGQRIDPTRLEVLVQQLAATGFDELAVKIALQLQQIRPVGEDVSHAWARAHLALGQVQEAVATLQKSSELNPRSARIWLRSAELLDDYGKLEAALPFYVAAALADHDSSRLRVRTIVTLLRLGRVADSSEALTSLAKLGGTQQDYDIILEVARRVHCQTSMLAAALAVTDADRDLERFRADLAADLGDKKALMAAIRRLRSKGAALGAEAVVWLQRVGDYTQAREIAEDSLASSEPVGAQDDSENLLSSALDVRRDPTSAPEALGIARLLVARAARPEHAAALAAQELGRHDLPVEGLVFARRFSLAQDLTFVALRASLAWQSGDPDEARRVWQMLYAALVVDPKVLEYVRNLDLSLPINLPERLRALNWMISSLESVGEFDLQRDYLSGLMQLAPTSGWVVHHFVSHQVRRGTAEQALAAMVRAHSTLKNWPDSFDNTADRLARDLGEQAIADVAGLSTDSSSSMALERAAAGVRTIPWWLGKALGSTPDLRPRSAPLAELLGQLTHSSSLMRTEMAIQYAGRGDGDSAALLLGDRPMACQDGNLPKVIRAMALTLAALQGPAATPKAGATEATAVASTWLSKWLDAGFGVDFAIFLAAELVRQGHPELAVRCLQAAPVKFAGTTADLLQRRMLAYVGVGSAQQVADAALLFLRGNRSQIARDPGKREVMSPSDDVFSVLISAGRVDAARLLALELRRAEPSVALPKGLNVDGPNATMATRIAAWDRSAVTDLLASRDLPAVEVLASALPLAVAASPTMAVGLAERMVAAGNEAWRVWIELSRRALDFGETALAQLATERAARTGAPANLLVCMGLSHGTGTDIGGCRRGRTLDSLSTDEMADLAMFVATSAESTATAAIAQALIVAASSNQIEFVAAAATRRQLMSAGDVARLGQWLRSAIAQLSPARSDSLILTALEDLGILGLADLGMHVTAAALANQPHTTGHHNNLSYAMYLAGRPPSESMAHALVAERGASGDSAAAAALDTLAAVRHQAGHVAAAIETLKRALAATVAPSVQARTPPGLSLARYAEFLLQAGHVADAHAVAAVTLGRSRPDWSTRDEWSALSRLRQLLKITLRQPAKQAP
ncbi:MAG: hypothetical protein EXR77_08660 [Myxococcales bacterium]|nr:hypothetical protein [Myxococcales bacterium]